MHLTPRCVALLLLPRTALGSGTYPGAMISDNGHAHAHPYVAHLSGYLRNTCICHAWHIHVYLKYRIMPSYYLKPSSPPEKISFACLSYLT